MYDYDLTKATWHARGPGFESPYLHEFGLESLHGLESTTPLSVWRFARRPRAHGLCVTGHPETKRDEMSYTS